LNHSTRKSLRRIWTQRIGHIGLLLSHAGIQVELQVQHGKGNGILVVYSQLTPDNHVFRAPVTRNLVSRCTHDPGRAALVLLHYDHGRTNMTAPGSQRITRERLIYLGIDLPGGHWTVMALQRIRWRP
jgi:hypothetical protein